MNDLKKAAEHASIVENRYGWEREYWNPSKQLKQWVGLTHEELDEIDQNCRSQMEAMFAVEAKLKEKNT